MSYPPPPGQPEENNPYASQDPYAPQPTPGEPQYPAYQQPYGQYAVPAPVGGNNGLAIASMSTGIGSIVLACCCWPLGIVGGAVALVLGFISLNQIRDRQQSNRGMAIAGLATGGVAVLLGIALLIVTLVYNTGSFLGNYNFN